MTIYNPFSSHYLYPQVADRVAHLRQGQAQDPGLGLVLQNSAPQPEPNGRTAFETAGLEPDKKLLLLGRPT